MAPAPEPIFLLHGQPGRGRDWDRLVHALGDRFDAINVDRPGWDGRREAVGLAANGEAAIAALDARGVQSATVVGHSFGAAVACWLAAQFPERVKALVLAAPAANVASLYRLDRWLATPGAGFLASAAGLELAGLALGARRVRRRIAAELKLDEDYLEGAGRVLRAPAAWRAFVVEQRALVHELPILESRLSLIAAPATIVIGSRDRIVPPRSARRLSEQIPQAELVVLERAGHLLPLQNASRLAEIVAQASAA